MVEGLMAGLQKTVAQLTNVLDERNLQILQLQKKLESDATLKQLRGEKAALEHRCQTVQRNFRLHAKEAEESIRKRDERIAALSREVRGVEVPKAVEDGLSRQLDKQILQANERIQTVTTELRFTRNRLHGEEQTNRELSTRLLSLQQAMESHKLEKEAAIQQMQSEHRRELETSGQAVEVARDKAAHREKQAEMTRAERHLITQMKQLVKVYKKKVDAAEKTEGELQKATLRLSEMETYKLKFQEKQSQLEKTEEELGMTKAMAATARGEVERWKHMAKQHLAADEDLTPEALRRAVVCSFQETEKLTQKMTEAESAQQQGEAMLAERAEQLRKVTSQSERLRGTIMIKDRALDAVQKQRKQLDDRLKLLQLELTGERRTPTGDRTDRAIKSLQTQIIANEQALAERDALITELCKMKEEIMGSGATSHESLSATRTCATTEKEEKERLQKLVEAVSEENRILKMTEKVQVHTKSSSTAGDEMVAMRKEMERLQDALSAEQIAFREFRGDDGAEGGRKRRREDGGREELASLLRQVEAEQARAHIVKKYLEDAIKELRDLVNLVLGWEIRIQDDEWESCYTFRNLHNKHDGEVVFTRRKEANKEDEELEMSLNGYYISKWESNPTWRGCYSVGKYALFLAKTLVLEHDGAEGKSI
eukprot:GHVS01034740.1.p1 GENE.GHVS01034740.1~~GHVS01034740.1.p1  ORF type:complete len:656 (+),score=144.67 GHVS01034740.1:133-2100(+)